MLIIGLGKSNYYVGYDSPLVPKYYYQNRTSLETFPSLTSLDQITYVKPIVESCLGNSLCGMGPTAISLAGYSNNFRSQWTKLLVGRNDSLLFNTQDIIVQAGHNLRKFVLKRFLEAKFNDGTTLALGRRPGPTVDSKLWQTSDFLMAETPSNYDAVSLKSQMENFNMDSVYGPGTLSVLEEIGYATTRRLQNFRLISDPDVMPIFGN